MPHKIELPVTFNDTTMYVLRSRGNKGPITLCSLSNDGNITYQALTCLSRNITGSIYETFIYAADDGPPKLHIVVRNLNRIRFSILCVSPDSVTIVCTYSIAGGIISGENVKLQSCVEINIGGNESYLQLVGDLLYVSLPMRLVCVNMRTLAIDRVIEHNNPHPWKFYVTPYAIYVMCNRARYGRQVGIVYVYYGAVNPIYHDQWNSDCFEGYSQNDRTLYMKIAGKRYKCTVVDSESIEITRDNVYQPAFEGALVPMSYHADGMCVGISSGTMIDGKIVFTNDRLVIVDADGNKYEINIDADQLQDYCVMIA